MIEISLTTFGDFLAASGRRKISTVRDARGLYEQAYSPMIDYWKLLREGIVDFHAGRADTKRLETIVNNSNSRKRGQFQEVLRSYLRWEKRVDWTWIEAESAFWEHAGIRVRCNPELGLRIDEDDYVVKLYFRSQKLRDLQVEATLELMSEALPGVRSGQRVAALLDIRQGRLLKNRNGRVETAALLRGEAAAFSEMWVQMEEAA